MKVYHGTKQINHDGVIDLSRQKSGYYPGFYTTTDIDYAKTYGGLVLEFEFSGLVLELSPEAADTLKAEARKEGFGYSQANGKAEVAMLVSRGYSAIKRGIEVIVIQPEKAVNIN